METKYPVAKIYNPMIYRLFYGMFVVLSIYYLLSNQLGNAVTNMGIALIFDPFILNRNEFAKQYSCRLSYTGAQNYPGFAK